MILSMVDFHQEHKGLNVSKNKLKFRDTEKVQSKLARKANEKTRQQYRADQRLAKRNFEE
jgi:hypothetical protein